MTPIDPRYLVGLVPTETQALVAYRPEGQRRLTWRLWVAALLVRAAAKIAGVRVEFREL